MSVTPPPLPDAAPPRAVLAVEILNCPQCGYDLRGIDSARCPECGLKIDRAAALHSLIPWTYRRANGRILTYFQTVWLMTKGVRRFRDETTRPVSHRDARRFWMVTSTLISLLLVIPAAAIGLFGNDWDKGLASLTPSGAALGTASFNWAVLLVWDGYLPWMTGSQILGVLAIATVAMTFGNMAMLPLLLNRRSLTTTQRARAVALGHYACAPLAWWPVLILLTVAMGAARAAVGGGPARRGIEVYVWGIWSLLVMALPPLITWLRSASLYAALTHGGFARTAWATFLLPILWLLNAGFWLLVFPWLIGGIWLLWWSL